jgi:hypothetical protein
VIVGGGVIIKCFLTDFLGDGSFFLLVVYTLFVGDLRFGLHIWFTQIDRFCCKTM